METYILSETEAGERLDALLPHILAGITRSAAARLIESGAVTVNGRPVAKKYVPVPGDELGIELPQPEETELVPQNIPLDVVYEDSDLIVVNKPRGMVVHPAPGHPDGTLVNALLYRCGDSLSGIGGEKRPGIVHRIDRDTSGLLIAAKNDFAHQSLSAQLSDHSLFRIYEAVVCGRVREDEGTVDAPIGRHPTDRKRMAVTERSSRPAVTHYQVIARYKGYTHLRCRLETGRTHQIRVHMEKIGHPIAGDMVYGRKRAEKGLEGQCLHAREIEFTHPRSGERVHLCCELPDYFKEFLSKLGPPEN
ncbi:MAG: RluA family pseudouridine synthase [Oscillospiraceae bacterium]